MLALTVVYFMSPFWRPEFYGDSSSVGKFVRLWYSVSGREIRVETDVKLLIISGERR